MGRSQGGDGSEAERAFYEAVRQARLEQGPSVRAEKLRSAVFEFLDRASSAEIATNRPLLRDCLVEVVDLDFEKYWSAGPSERVWHLLYQHEHSSRADWFCELGDLASRRGEVAKAARRYELADRFGCSRARAQMSRLKNADSYRCLLDGDVAGAKIQMRGRDGEGPYRYLLRLAAALMSDEPAAGHLADLASSKPDGGINLSVLFLTALARLRDGNPQAAREKLRHLLDASARSGSSNDLTANARIILGVLDQDDRLVATGARALLDRHRDSWPARLMAAPLTVLTAVSRGDPRLLPELAAAARHDAGLARAVGKLDELHVTAVRGILAETACAALLSRTDTAHALLARARQQLARLDVRNGPATSPGGAAEPAMHQAVADLRDRAARIGEIVTRLGVTAASDRPLDRLACSLLRQDGVTFPWTERAECVWEAVGTERDGDPPSLGPLHLHHLAIAQHARAYELELADDDAAFAHWRKALEYWARLHGDDGFWELMRTHLTTVMPGAASTAVACAVEAARHHLPSCLLDPHLVRAVQLREDYLRAQTQRDPTGARKRLSQARTHMSLIRAAPFSDQAISQSCSRLAGHADSKVTRLRNERSFEEALDELQSWLEIDATNISLAELALGVGIEAVKATPGRGHDLIEQVGPVLNRVERLVGPSRKVLGLTTEQVTAMRRKPSGADRHQQAFIEELAKYEYWLGWCDLESARSQLEKSGYTLAGIGQSRYVLAAEFGKAAVHAEAAEALGVPDKFPYSQAHMLMVEAKKWERWLRGNGIFGFG